MSSKCRLCGDAKTTSEFLNLDSKIGEKSIRDTVSYHCRISVHHNEALPPNVCSTCKGTLEMFSHFSETVANQQNVFIADEHNTSLADLSKQAEKEKNLATEKTNTEKIVKRLCSTLKRSDFKNCSVVLHRLEGLEEFDSNSDIEN